MGRRRDHYPRFDTTACPDPAACERLFHPQMVVGDVCECCGATVEPPATWEPVRDPTDRRRVVYYRLSRGERHIGSVSRKPEGWRALLYGEQGRGRSHVGRRELGMFPTQRQAQRGVEAAHFAQEWGPAEQG